MLGGEIKSRFNDCGNVAAPLVVRLSSLSSSMFSAVLFGFMEFGFRSGRQGWKAAYCGRQLGPPRLALENLDDFVGAAAFSSSDDLFCVALYQHDPHGRFAFGIRRNDFRSRV